MINLTILDSPDLIVCDTFEFFTNHITIGNVSCDINIDDSKLFRHHLTIELTPDGKLVLEPGPRVQNYYINGKITKTKSTLRPKQTVQIGETIFIITSYQYEKENNIKSLRDEKLVSLSKSQSEKWKLVEKIKAEMQ